MGECLFNIRSLVVPYTNSKIGLHILSQLSRALTSARLGAAVRRHELVIKISHNARRYRCNNLHIELSTHARNKSMRNAFFNARTPITPVNMCN